MIWRIDCDGLQGAAGPPGDIGPEGPAGPKVSLWKTSVIGWLQHCIGCSPFLWRV